MKKPSISILTVALFGLLSSQVALADTTIKIYKTSDKTEIGTVTAKDSPYGLLLTPNLTGLTPGIHGFHVHQLASCENKGLAAGGHLDPNKTGKHLGPYDNEGHLGDLPPLYADASGHVSLPIVAPRLKLADLKNHSLMVHEGGDNYSDQPAKLGGGGARFACGVIP